jgi:hypothetical protein
MYSRKSRVRFCEHEGHKWRTLQLNGRKYSDLLSVFVHLILAIPGCAQTVLGTVESCRPAAPVSHILCLTARAISRRSMMQLYMRLGVTYAPEMTRTSDLRFRKTSPDRFGAGLSATHC